MVAHTFAPVPVSTPCAVVDAVLDAAISAGAERFVIEPCSRGYRISIERDAAVVAASVIDAGIARAAIARLAYIANVDLAATQTVVGTARIRTSTNQCGLIVTLSADADPMVEALLVRPKAPRVGEPAIGDIIDHYRVVERCGSGGMGRVYEVEQVSLGRRFALKVLHRHVMERDATAADRFMSEARAAARIRHPNVVDVVDFGYLADRRPYFVMELLDATSVADIIDDEARGALDPALAIDIARQLADALAAAHACDVIHADVSAANVLIGTHGNVKLVDFGLAQLRQPDHAEDTELCFGTPCYVAPEMLRGRPATERSDQYAFGVLCWEMLVGRPPFVDANLRELCMKHLSAPVPVPISPYGELPDELVYVIERCMAKSPEARFGSMREVKAALAILGDR
jgi:serine/threonine protein kinase